MTSIADQINAGPDQAEIGAAIKTYAKLLGRETRGTCRPDDGELLKQLCTVLGYTPDVFLHTHAPAAATVHTLLEEAASESSWRAQCKDRAEKIAGLRHKVYQADQQAADRARHALRDHERHRNRAISGIKKAEGAAASLDRMRKKHAWADAFIALVDGKFGKPKRKKAPVNKARA